MKRILLGLVILSGLFYSTSCSNEFDLITDWKDIPVVYGLLSTADTAHYVRVEKAFLDPNTSALELAQNIDSIYYPNATVKLVDVVTSTEYPFTRVDGNLEGYKREEGVFADSPNWLYKLKTDGTDTIKPNRVYELIVGRNETSEPVTARVTTVSDLTISAPAGSVTNVSFYSQGGGGNPVVPVNFIYKWKYEPDNTVIFDVALTFHYTETAAGVTTNKSFRRKLRSGSPPTNDGTPRDQVVLDPVAFYQSIAGNITGENVVRNFVSLEFEVIGGDQAFSDYLSVNQANTGLTSSQLIPNFTNFTEGYGLFASIYKINQHNFMDLASRDSLRQGQYTQQLNFQ